MPLLEQPRRPRPHPARLFRFLKLFLLDVGRRTGPAWPAVWLACQLSGFALGGAWGNRTPATLPLPPEAWLPGLVRTAAALPLLLIGPGGAAPSLVWAAVTGTSAAAGACEAGHRRRRRQAVAAEAWTPASAAETRGDAVLRLTGWPQESAPGRWSGPMCLLAWSPAVPDQAGTDGPQVGQGLLVTGQGPAPAPGAVIAAPLAVQVPAVAAVPGGFDRRRFLTGRGLRWQARLSAHRPVPDDLVARCGGGLLAPLRANLLDRIDRLLPGTEARVVAAVLLGARTPDSRETSNRFGALGLAHLFAVSGLHVGILLGVVLLPGRWLGWGPRLMAGPLLVLVPLYALLTGLPGSVVRAGGMGVLAVSARPCGRRSDPLRLLGLLYWAGAVSDPVRLLDSGLQMSYLAAGGILLVSRATNGFRFAVPKIWGVILTGLAVSFAAQWFTLPLAAAGFGRFSLLSPLANLLAVPLFGLTVWAVVLALLSGLVWAVPANLLGALAWLGLRCLGAGAALTGRHTGGLNLGLPPPGPLQVGAWALLTLGFFLLLRVRGPAWRRHLARGAAWCGLPCILLWVMGPNARSLPDPEAVVVWQFAVGQGDCALVTFPDRWTAMIDTGGRFNVRNGTLAGPLTHDVLPFLQRQGLAHLDAVLLTHGHLDHTGGAVALAEAVTVGRWYTAGKAAEALRGTVDSVLVDQPAAGEVLHAWQDWNLSIAYPAPGQAHAPSENDWSLVAVLRRGDRAEMVWSGDLEHEGEALLLGSGHGPGPTRIWKAGHHGSNTSGSPAWLSELRPDLILVSCGVGNSYRHPSHGPFLRPNGAAADTVPLLRTDLEGSLRLRWSAQDPPVWRTEARAGQLARMP